MTRLLLPLPALALLAACGGGDAITTTAENQVVLNDSQANYAFANDGEGPIANEMADDNMAMPMGNDAIGMNGADAMSMNDTGAMEMNTAP